MSTEKQPDGIQFSSIEETKAGMLSAITEKPPSPMPTPQAATEKVTEFPEQFPKKQPDAQIVSEASEKLEVSETVSVDFEKWSKYKDYKGNSFSPSLHKLKENGEPELTREGKLKLLPPSKRNIVQKMSDSVKSAFNVPLSDHELSEKEEAAARVQGQAVAKFESLTASAELGSELYFGVGSAMFSGGFLENKKSRKPKIKEALIQYERATGKGFDLPPGVTLALVMFADVSEQCMTNKDCGDRVSMVKGAIFREGVKTSIKDRAAKLWPWSKKKKEAENVSEFPEQEEMKEAA